ncbi:MAG TPA: SufS family cysteine desulfurase [Nevskiaceae bacterium]|nr:SufS family cysteine desulfurase [Nevskiaceae bacterium]
MNRPERIPRDLRANVANTVDRAGLDVAAIRVQFPILKELTRGKRLAYLDNSATTQKPEAVIRALDHYYRHDNANVHRGMHELAERATAAYEHGRDAIAHFLNAPREQIVFARGATEAINLVARCFIQPTLKTGDEVLVTGMEHHSNIVPWQLAGAKTIGSPVRDDGSLDLEAWKKLLGPHTRLAAITHVSNTLGTVNPVAEMIEAAHARGIPVLVDGAQAVAHMKVDVTALDVDFYAFSSHKVYGPTGFGALYAKREHLEAMPPWHGGGDMIRTVAFEGSTYSEVPYKFEAGTPDIAGAVGTGAALEWLEGVGLDAVHTHEQALLKEATARLQSIPGLRIIGTAPGKGAIISFVLEGSHPQDVGDILSMEGVATRTGHHCTMPLMHRFCVPGTVRASFAVYNDVEDIEQLEHALHTAVRLLG